MCMTGTAESGKKSLGSKAQNCCWHCTKTGLTGFKERGKLAGYSGNPLTGVILRKVLVCRL